MAKLDVKKISENSFLLTGLLILFGSTYFYSYYNEFRINYYSYASASEIIFSFLSIIVPIIIFASLFLALKYDSFENWNILKYVSKLNITKYRILNSLIKIVIYLIFIPIIVLLSFIIFFIPIMGTLPIPIKYCLDINLMYFLFDKLLPLAVLIAFSYRMYIRKKLRSIFHFTSAVAFVVYFSVLGSVRGQIVKKVNGIKEIEIKTEEKFNSDLENYFFVGQTSQYLIMFSSKEKKSLIISKKNISSISFKNKYN